MSLIKFNNRNSLLPSWNNDSFFNNDFFEEDSLMPTMNVKESKKDFEIEFAAPGFSKKDFEITINENVLNVCGDKKKKTEEKTEGYTRKEYSYNSFKRSVQLTKSFNADQNVKATYKDGILKLSLQKKEETKENPKKVIEIL